MKPTPLFYIFHGADELTRSEAIDRFKRQLGPREIVDLNTTVLERSQASLPEIRHVCESVPFMAEKRLVIAVGLLSSLLPQQGRTMSAAQKEASRALCEYLPGLPETARLVFTEDAPLPSSHPVVKLAQSHERGYIKQFDAPDARSLPRWIGRRAQRHGGQIDPAAADRLATLAADNLRVLDQEIVKLITYTNGERPITLEDIEALVPYAQQAIVFDLVDALGLRDGRVAARTLHQLLDAGEHPLGLLAMVVRQFRLLIQVKDMEARGADLSEVIEALRIHPFPARKLHNQATHFTLPQLETVYRRLLDMDVAIKTGETDAELALDTLIAGLAATDP